MGCNNLARELEEVLGAPKDRGRLGDFGERVTSELLTVLGATDVLVDLGHRDRPQGVDVLVVDGGLLVAESKATAVDPGVPRLAKGQLTTEWITSRLNTTSMLADQLDAPLTAADVESNVQSILVKVDVANSEVTTWSVDGAGAVDRSAPDAIFDLADIIAFSQNR